MASGPLHPPTLERLKKVSGSRTQVDTYIGIRMFYIDHFMIMPSLFQMLLASSQQVTW
jgi:hypothetical protein